MPTLTFSSVAPAEVFWNVTPSAVGPLLLGFTKQRQLCRITFLEKRKPAAALKDWKKEWPSTTFTENQKTPHLTEKTPIHLVGTDFQHRVWSALLDIPAGDTLTYGELAAKLGKPSAARAVGTALGKNPVPLIVPCHRIVSSTGLGGFTGNLDIKRALLNTEALQNLTKK